MTRTRRFLVWFVAAAGISIILASQRSSATESVRNIIDVMMVALIVIVVLYGLLIWYTEMRRRKGQSRQNDDSNQ